MEGRRSARAPRASLCPYGAYSFRSEAFPAASSAKRSSVLIELCGHWVNIPVDLRRTVSLSFSGVGRVFLMRS